jgi:hypothetical protein
VPRTPSDLTQPQLPALPTTEPQLLALLLLRQLLTTKRARLAVCCRKGPSSPHGSSLLQTIHTTSVTTVHLSCLLAEAIAAVSPHR